MALLSITQITHQLRNTILNNAAVSTLLPKKSNNSLEEEEIEKPPTEIVVYPRRVKGTEKIVITLASTTSTSTSTSNSSTNSSSSSSTSTTSKTNKDNNTTTTTTTTTTTIEKTTTTTNNHVQRSALNMPVTPHYIPPRAPIVLCHGLYGFDKIGPDALPLLQVQYWGGIENALAKLGAKVIVTKVPSTGSIWERAQTLHSILKSILEGQDVNFIAHSMGGLDCRYLISHIGNRPYKVNSLTTISTPHRGSPVMDWFRDNVGVGMAGAILANATNESIIASKKQQQQDMSIASPNFQDPSSYAAEKFKLSCSEKQQDTPNHNQSALNSWSSFLSKSPKFDPIMKRLIQLVDTAAYANLTTDYCTNYFNPNTPNDPNVSYYSYGANATFPSWSILNLPAGWVREKEGMNDGLVSVKSAKWGQYMKTLEGADHWDLNGQRYRWRHTRPFLDKTKFDTIDFYMEMATHLYHEGH